MLKKVKEKKVEVQKNWHDKFAEFKKEVRGRRDKKFPKQHMEIDLPSLPKEQESSKENAFSTKKMLLFRLIGLAMVAIAYFLFNTLSYVYMIIAAFIISLAMEGVIIFWQRLTRSRGVGILMAYLLLILFLLSGFLIIVPFMLSWGTQVLQGIVTYAQGIQTDILTQGIDAYIRGISRLPSFLHDDILGYIKSSNSASVIQTITDNLGNIVNLSSSYLKVIGEYAVNIFGGIFSAAGKLVILFTLCVFFSLSHYEVKYGLKYLTRGIKNSKEKIEESYGGISSRLKSQLLLCVFIGVTSYLALRILELIGFPLPQKGVLALLAGLFEIIPYLGPFLGGLPAAVFALMLHGFPGVVAVIITYTIIQQFEGNVLIPVMMSKTLGVNPLLVFVCMLFGGLIMGIFGVLLAVPIAVIFSIVFKLPDKPQEQPTIKKKPTLKDKNK